MFNFHVFSAPCTPNIGSDVIVRDADGNTASSTVTLHGNVVYYDCPLGYYGIGTTIVTCTDGSWDAPDQFSCYGKMILFYIYYKVYPISDRQYLSTQVKEELIYNALLITR